jgi:hypothetical protein
MQPVALANHLEASLMEKWKIGIALLGAFLLCAAFAPRTKADPWDHKTVVTFGDSVEIPGQVLPAGTYVFKLMNSASDRHIVQIWTGDEQELIATIHTIANQRMEPAGDTIFEFDERPSDSPQALRAWFYPGATTGEEFVYSYSSYNPRYNYSN